MTTQAIIFVDPKENSHLLFEKVNGRIFLHYQLQYLAENWFKKIVIVESPEMESLQTFFKQQYIGMEMVYLKQKDGETQIESIQKALDFIDENYVFILNAHYYFRLNMPKADDFRRMRDTKMLLIGRHSENYTPDILPHLYVDDRGKLEKSEASIGENHVKVYVTETWLLQKNFGKGLSNSKNKLIDHFTDPLNGKTEYSMACRQYLLHLSSQNQIDQANNDFTENHY